jgi:phage tail tube protein FII
VARVAETCPRVRSRRFDSINGSKACAELARDAALRDAAGTLESQGIQAAFAAIEKAIRVAAARRELLQFAGNCLAVGKFSLAGAIVDQFPGDDQALLLDARITMKLVNSGQWGDAEPARAAQQL